MVDRKEIIPAFKAAIDNWKRDAEAAVNAGNSRDVIALAQAYQSSFDSIHQDGSNKTVDDFEHAITSDDNVKEAIKTIRTNHNSDEAYVQQVIKDTKDRIGKIMVSNKPLPSYFKNGTLTVTNLEEKVTELGRGALDTVEKGNASLNKVAKDKTGFDFGGKIVPAIVGLVGGVAANAIGGGEGIIAKLISVVVGGLAFVGVDKLINKENSFFDQVLGGNKDKNNQGQQKQKDSPGAAPVKQATAAEAKGYGNDNDKIERKEIVLRKDIGNIPSQNSDGTTTNIQVPPGANAYIDQDVTKPGEMSQTRRVFGLEENNTFKPLSVVTITHNKDKVTAGGANELWSNVIEPQNIVKNADGQPVVVLDARAESKISIAENRAQVVESHGLVKRADSQRTARLQIMDGMVNVTASKLNNNGGVKIVITSKSHPDVSRTYEGVMQSGNLTINTIERPTKDGKLETVRLKDEDVLRLVQGNTTDTRLHTFAVKEQIATKDNPKVIDPSFFVYSADGMKALTNLVSQQEIANLTKEPIAVDQLKPGQLTPGQTPAALPPAKAAVNGPASANTAPTR